MPLYEYECRACGAHFEAMRKVSDRPLRSCPTCKSRRLRKLISAPAFQFKGSGWYVTDYARKKDGGEKDGGEKDGGEKDKGKDKEGAGKEGATKEAKSSDSGSSSQTETASAKKPKKDGAD